MIKISQTIWNRSKMTLQVRLRQDIWHDTSIDYLCLKGWKLISLRKIISLKWLSNRKTKKKSLYYQMTKQYTSCWMVRSFWESTRWGIPATFLLCKQSGKARLLVILSLIWEKVRYHSYGLLYTLNKLTLLRWISACLEECGRILGIESTRYHCLIWTWMSFSKPLASRHYSTLCMRSV